MHDDTSFLYYYSRSSNEDADVSSYKLHSHWLTVFLVKSVIWRDHLSWSAVVASNYICNFFVFLVGVRSMKKNDVKKNKNIIYNTPKEKKCKLTKKM